MKKFAVHEMDVTSVNLTVEGFSYSQNIIVITKFGCVVSKGNSLGCRFQFSQLDPLFVSPVQLECE